MMGVPRAAAPVRPDKTYELVGESTQMRQILRLAQRLGRGNWPVLLLGETGTGKELVARTIHRHGPEGPFVTIDCSAMVGPLMESELFGHVKGAFTGAAGNKIGLIEQANGGSAFFDEIGELPLDLQAKLLRVLQEQEFRPVGGLEVRRSRFRVIAATNRDLAKEVERGKFRQDLFYRLNVVTMRLTPVRDRREDLPALIQHFLDRYGNHHIISQELMDLMMEYEWPGNVRELENCIQHMVAVNSGPVLHTADAPSILINAVQSRSLQRLAELTGEGRGQAPDALAALAQFPSSPQISGVPQPILPLAEVEKRAILSALEYTKGDRLTTAQLLGIGRTTLYRKLKEYGYQG